MDQYQSAEFLGIFPPPQRLTITGATFLWPANPSVRWHGAPSVIPPIIVRQLNSLDVSAITTAAAIVDVIIDSALPHAQEYELTIGENGVHVRASDPQGAAYALQTLKQIITARGNTIPAVQICDWPELMRRGFYLDVSRGKVPSIEKLESIIRYLAELRYNEFQLYIENVFAFPGHEFYADTTPLTASDIQHLDHLCAQNGIEFVPSLASLGHFEKILRHPRYRHLAEIEPTELAARGIKPWCNDPWTLCISDPAALSLLSGMYDAFLPNFSSRHFNICCDESWDLALGRSRDYADQIGGVGEAYVRWIRQCATMATRHGKSVALWGDIILNHPEKIPSLPNDATLLEWGYEADHPFEEHGEIFARAGRPWYVCPGTSSWQSFGGRLDTALSNIRCAVAAGRRHGAAGMLLTDWGDYGHQQCFAVSVIPLIAGGAIAWNPQSRDADIDRCVARMVGHLPAVDALKLLGTIHGRIATARPRNSSLEFHLFREPASEHVYRDMFNPAAGGEVLAELEQSIAAVEGFSMPMDKHLHDGLLISLKMAAMAITHGLHRSGAKGVSDRAAQHQIITALADEYRTHWHRWNKPSRWVDIELWFQRLAAQYQ